VKKAWSLLFFVATIAMGQATLLVPYRLVIRGKPYTGSIIVEVSQSGQVIARGVSIGQNLAFRWNPVNEEALDVDVIAGRQRIAIKGVKPGDFRAVWLLEQDFPPFRNQCGGEVRSAERSSVVRVDCVVFDDRKGDPPQRAMIHKKTTSR